MLKLNKKTSGLWSVGILLFLSFFTMGCQETNRRAPFFATGIKIGEVTSNSAIIWVRLTKEAERVSEEAPMPEVFYKTDSGEWIKRPGGRRPDLPPKVVYPEGHDVTNIEGAVPGMEGYVQLKYKEKGTQNWQSKEWLRADKSTNFTNNIKLKNLNPNTLYEIELVSSTDRKKTGETIKGSFTTAPMADAHKPISFTATTCISYDDIDSLGYGLKIYDEMEKLKPSFFVHLGDILYYDDLGKTAELARWHWDRMFSLPAHVNFHKKIPSYFIKDDHDTWMDDSWPGRETRFMGDFTFEEGLKFFTEEVPVASPNYRTIRWGKDLQIWMVEGRDFRSPNTMPDGPDKTIWGQEQKDWFYKTVAASDATFKILLSPTPIVGPDRKNKNDNHANEGFSHEGKEIRNFLAEQENMYVVCGDRHWQYVSVDAETGVKEYSVGPGTDAHAGGWEADDKRPEHSFLRVKGGFLEVKINREKGIPTIKFIHRDVAGNVVNEEIIQK
ncbi:alkaline phosphatase D family protein [Gramella sp. AN32]|uniref:Alkaline phosphatase D family protein n=1 Tax=Christiangramia antarctica TaxID=2058158 RepID=A0ABW5X527_9FLAO|nr:alkaline phosphatase D family protein [Gramella sp. AN32]MCM4156722.1 alkaline phosphatase [Gramella sp. AN32]